MATNERSTPSSTNPTSARRNVHPLPRYPDIVLALNVIETAPPKFHWYLFVPNAEDAHLDVQSGLKMHATTDFSLGPTPAERTWCFDAKPTRLATDEGGLAAAAVIGQLPVTLAGLEEEEGPTRTGRRTLDALRDLLAQIPMAVPEADRAREPVFTCRVWVREAVRRMHEEGYVDCPDVDAMEEEMWRYGRAAASAIEDGTFRVAALVQSVASRAVSAANSSRN